MEGGNYEMWVPIEIVDLKKKIQHFRENDGKVELYSVGTSLVKVEVTQEASYIYMCVLHDTYRMRYYGTNMSSCMKHLTDEEKEKFFEEN